MTIEDFLRLLLRNALLLVLGAVLGAGVGYGVSFTRPEIYAASSLGYVSASGDSDEAGNPIAIAAGNMQFQYDKAQSYLPLFGTRAVGERIVEELGLEASPDAVAGSLAVSLDPNAPIITVTATAGSAEEASAIANAAVEAVAAEAANLETGGNSDVGVAVQLVPYQTALTPGAPISPDRRKFLAAGAAVGLGLALAVAWLRSRNDSRLRNLSDLPLAQDLALLGSLPALKEFSRSQAGVAQEPTSFSAREALRKLRTNLRYVNVDSPPRSIVVTSSTPGEGKSTVAVNLARVMARAGQRTLLIDADLRRPVVAASFDVDGSAGLSQLLAGTVTLDQVIHDIPDSRLALLPAGQIPPNPSELLGSRRMHDLIAELSHSYFLIIDAPPVLAVTDAQLLARHTDGAILVAIPGRTRVEPLARAVEAVQTVGGRVHGIVLNRVTSSRFTRLAYGNTDYDTMGYGTYAEYARGYDTRDKTPVGDERDIEADEPAPGSTEHTRKTGPSGPSASDEKGEEPLPQGGSRARRRAHVGDTPRGRGQS